MIAGHTLKIWARGAGYSTNTFECSCGWKRSGERITALRLNYRRHLYDVVPKIGDEPRGV